MYADYTVGLIFIHPTRWLWTSNLILQMEAVNLRNKKSPLGRQQRNRLCFMEGTLSLFPFKKSSFQEQEPWEKPAILSDTFYFQQLIPQDEGDPTAAQGFLGVGLEHSKATPRSSLRLQTMHLSPVKPFKSCFWTWPTKAESGLSGRPVHRGYLSGHRGCLL